MQRASSFTAAESAATVPTPQPRLGYLTPKQAAEFTNISWQELERLRRVGGGPRFSYVSARLIRYSVEDLCQWLASFAVANNSEAYERSKGVARV